MCGDFRRWDFSKWSREVRKRSHVSYSTVLKEGASSNIGGYFEANIISPCQSLEVYQIFIFVCRHKSRFRCIGVKICLWQAGLLYSLEWIFALWCTLARCREYFSSKSALSHSALLNMRLICASDKWLFCQICTKCIFSKCRKGQKYFRGHSINLGMHAGRLCEMRGDGGWEGCGFLSACAPS